jgi:hypothetical protein
MAVSGAKYQGRDDYVEPGADEEPRRKTDNYAADADLRTMQLISKRIVRHAANALRCIEKAGLKAQKQIETSPNLLGERKNQCGDSPQKPKN